MVQTPVTERGLEILCFTFLDTKPCLTVTALSREIQTLPSYLFGWFKKYTVALQVMSICEWV